VRIGRVGWIWTYLIINLIHLIHDDLPLPHGLLQVLNRHLRLGKTLMVIYGPTMYS